MHSDSTIYSLKPPKKRLAVFLDGTWNAVGTNTNVWRLRCLCESDCEDAAQLRYYDAGVNGVFGGGFGKGLSDNVREAYDWIVEHYEDGDEIFIFGFSRGAFTARSLAGLIATLGLLKPGGPLGADQLYSRYRMADTDRTIFRLRGGLPDTTKEEELLLKYSREAEIKMVGVWDTVGALGVAVPGLPGIGSAKFRFHHTGLRRPIQNAYHAVAIDEHRKKFLPTLWTVRTPPGQPPSPTRPISSVEQRWFVGAHANVGGGCQSDLLAQIPLRWMMRKASALGLRFRNDLDLDGSEALDSISDSYAEFLHGIYRFFSRRHHRPVGAVPRVGPDGTHTVVNETIDTSVFERWRTFSDYRPPSLVEWATRYGTDPDTLTYSVSATDPARPIAD